MPISTSTSLAGLTVKLHIDRAEDLVAKDKNWRGKKTGSDPFIRIYIDGTKVGYTKTINKTCDPVWDETLDFSFSADQVMKIVRNNKPIELRIFDKDVVSFSDPMGTVEIPLDISNSEATWYDVGRGKGSTQCDNATGKLLVAAEVKAIKYLELEPGQAHKIEHPRVRFGIAWDTLSKGWGGNKDVDVACVAVDRNGNVDLRECAYSGNLFSRNRSISHSGDRLSHRTYGDDEQVSVNFHDLPGGIAALYLVLSVVEQDLTLGGVAGTEIRMLDSNTGMGVCRYAQNDFGDQTTAYLVRIHKEPSEGRWYLRPMGQGDDIAHDFGAVIPQIKAYTRDVLPDIPLDPHGRKAIMRKQGAIRIKDYVERFPSNISFAVSWDFTPQPMPVAVNDEDIQEVEDPNGDGERALGDDAGDGDGDGEQDLPMDLDASVICLDKKREVIEIISKENLESGCHAIRHGGDEDDGSRQGDDERIRIFLYELNPKIKELVFVVNSANGQPLDSVKAASCRVFSAGKGAKEIATYKICQLNQLVDHTALIVASVYNPTYEGNNEDEEAWCLRIISDAAHGQTPEDTVDEVQNFLSRNPAPEAPELPELTEEILEACTMPPEPEPLGVDHEIVFLGDVM